MSFLIRLLQRFRHPTGFVGRDLQGNRFFEYPSTSDDPRRTKRVVKYAKGNHMLDYVSGHRRLAVQWTSWLTHTRPHPPTLEELQGDLERQHRVLQNVAMIEARERAEASRIAAQQSPTGHLQTPDRSASQGNHTEPMVTSGAVCKAAETSDSESPAKSPQGPPPSPWKPPPSDEPHSWQPRASVKRGS